MKKISGLSYIRAISAILIVLYHYTTRYFDIYFGQTFESDHVGVWWGCWAVSAFFVLSGFLTVYNLNKDTSFTTFLKKRVVRIYPTYILCVLITTLFILGFRKNEFIGVTSTLINMTAFQTLFGIKNVDGAYWTLLYELIFYLIVASVILIRQQDNFDIWCTLWLVVVVAYTFINRNIDVPSIISGTFTIVTLEKYAHTFIIGISLYYILSAKKRKAFSYINLIIGVLIHFLRFSELSGIFLVICIFLIVVFEKTKFSFKYDKILVFIAEISFPLYLLHQEIGYIIINTISGYGASYLVCIAIAIFVSIILATVVQYCMVKYLVKFIGNKIDSFKISR